MKATQPNDWKRFFGDREKPHDSLRGLPVPPWRRSAKITIPEKFAESALERDQKKAKPFLPDPAMVWAVNAALYLRRPLLLTGKPGSGKSTLISKVATELML